MRDEKNHLYYNDSKTYMIFAREYKRTLNYEPAEGNKCSVEKMANYDILVVTDSNPIHKHGLVSIDGIASL